MAYYETEIRRMVWRVEGDHHYALVMARTAGEAVNRANARHLFDKVDKVSGPWEKSRAHVLAID